MIKIKFVYLWGPLIFWSLIIAALTATSIILVYYRYTLLCRYVFVYLEVKLRKIVHGTTILNALTWSLLQLIFNRCYVHIWLFIFKLILLRNVLFHGLNYRFLNLLLIGLIKLIIELGLGQRHCWWVHLRIIDIGYFWWQKMQTI